MRILFPLLKINLILTITFLLFAGIGLSQEPGQILWKELYGGSVDEVFYDIEQTSDSGYIAVGYTTTYGPVQDVKSLWAVKTDNVGDTLWTRVIGLGISYGDLANSVSVDADGSLVIVGETYSYAANEKDAWILKLDSEGNTQWTATYDGGSYDVASAVIINEAGNYAVTGYSINAAGNRDALFLEYDKSGNLLKDFTYGGSEDDWTNDLCQTTDNGYVLSGYTESFGVTGQDVYLIKINNNADTVWTTTYGGSLDQFGRAIAALSNGGVIVSGWTGTFVVSSDILLLKVTSSGSILWTETYNFGLIDTSNDIIVTFDGGYLMSGKGNDDFLALKVYDDGEVEWFENSFTATGVSVNQNMDGDYIFCGAEHIGIKAQGMMVCIKGDPFNHAPGDFSLLLPEDGDTLSSITEPVNFVWETSVDPEGDPLTYTLKIFNPDLSLFYPMLTDTTYSFDGSSVFEENTIYNWTIVASDGELTTVADTFTFVTPLINGDYNANISQKTALYQNYPNPFSKTTTIEFSLAKSSIVILEIFNFQGQKIHSLVTRQMPIGNNTVMWDGIGDSGNRVSKGMYVYRIITEGDILSQIMIVE